MKILALLITNRVKILVVLIHLLDLYRYQLLKKISGLNFINELIHQ